MKIACVLALLCAAGAAAADDGCSAAVTQRALNECARRNFQAADAALNIAYGGVMERLPDDKRPLLRKEQRAWLNTRDTACKAQVRGSEGGSIWELEFYSCLEVSTKKRTEKVKAWMDGNRS